MSEYSKVIGPTKKDSEWARQQREKLEIANATKSFCIVACIDETWDKEINITLDGNLSKVQAEKVFRIFYPNAITVNDIRIREF